MASTILLSDNGSTSGISGYQLTGGTDGTLTIQTTTSGGTPTTAVSIDNTQNTTVAGNLTLSGTGKRITGDFSNATIANQFAFQTSITNGTTNVNALPNGTGNTALFRAFDNSDQTNASFCDIRVTGATDARFTSSRLGTGTYLPMTFYTGGSERMRIDASGNVGIGTSSPSTYNSNASYNKVTSIVQSDQALTFSAYYQGGVGQYGVIRSSNAANTGITDMKYEAYQHLFFTAAGASGTERMRIDSSGNVGIGTSSPSSKLDVVTSGPAIVKSQSTNNFGSFYANGATGNAAYYFFAVNATETGRIYSEASNYIGFATGNAGVERMRIDSSGNLLVGTTNSTIGVSGIGIQTRSNPGNPLVFLNSSGAVAGYVQVNNTTTSYGTSSDYRLKENIAPMEGALSVVAQLKPCTYTWKADGSDGQGFIAHELQAVVPDCVTGEKDAVDAEGNPVYQGIDTSFLVATLTAAIQEQQALITSLTERITALEAK